jgi:hypothetical protein
VKATLLLHHDATPEQSRIVERFVTDLLRSGASVTLQGAPFDGTWRKPADKMPEPEVQILLYDSYGVRLGHLTQSQKWFYRGAANDYETSKAPDYWCQIPPLAP